MISNLSKDISSFKRLNPIENDVQLTERITDMFFNIKGGNITKEMFDDLNISADYFKGLLQTFNSHKEYIKPSVIGSSINNNYDFNYTEERNKRLKDENKKRIDDVNKMQGSFSSQLTSSEADFIIAIKNAEGDIFTETGAQSLLKDIFNKLSVKVANKELTKKIMTQRMRILTEAWKQGYANAKLGGKTNKATKLLILEKAELKKLMMTPLRRNPEKYIDDIKKIIKIMEDGVFRQYLVSAEHARRTFTRKSKTEKDSALRRMYEQLSKINLKIFENSEEAFAFIQMSKKKRKDIDLQETQEYLNKLHEKEAAFFNEEQVEKEGAGELGIPSDKGETVTTNYEQKKKIIKQLIRSAAREIARRTDIMKKNGFFNQDVFDYLTKIDVDELSYSELREYYEGMIIHIKKWRNVKK